MKATHALALVAIFCFAVCARAGDAKNPRAAGIELPTVFVPTQVYRTADGAIFYGYKPLKAYTELAQRQENILAAPKLAYIIASANTPEKTVRQWRRKIVDEKEAIASAKKENELPPIAERVQTSLEETNGAPLYISKNGRMETLEQLNGQIERDPNNAAARYARASIFHEWQEFDRAIADYDEVIRLDPKNASAFYKRGLCRVAVGQTDLSISDFQQANRLAPETSRPWSQLGGEWSRQRGY